MLSDLARNNLSYNKRIKTRDLQHRVKLSQTADPFLKYRTKEYKPYTPIKSTDIPLEELIKLPKTDKVRAISRAKIMQQCNLYKK